MSKQGEKAERGKESREATRGGGASTKADDGSWSSFVGCDNFYHNTTEKTQTVTIQIENTGDFSLDIDIAGSGQVVSTIPSGKTRTITVEVPAGDSLHAGSEGKYRDVQVS